ncbi:glucose-6-phosphate dehydrogenase [Modestobacter versicolor]|uniref:glucose-6-phosphate dehydrogenase n=1 Tax=Modestobacter versicolor TaxID=429133 RepID=UPI0034DED91F
MIDRLLLLGATGDLAGRFLLPALAWLTAAGRVPDDLQVVGAAAQDWDDETFRAHVAGRSAAAGELPDDAGRALLARLRYRRFDAGDPATVAAAVAALPGDGPVAAYLALPPALFPATLRALGAAGLPPGSRIAVEKPFGADLAGAVALDALLAEVAGDERAVTRVDHFLGMSVVQELLGRHAAGGDLTTGWDLATGWDSRSVEEVEVVWEETLGLEGRADFYDRTGALRDVLQNHLLQVLVLLAMEQPADGGEQALHAAKLDLLRSLRLADPTDPAACTRRARYTAGTLAAGGASAAVPGYADEDGVDPARGTETYAEVLLAVDTPRWAGTRFRLRTGKAMPASRKGVAVHPRTAGPPRWTPLEEPERGTGAAPGELAAYCRVLTDVLAGGSVTSVSGPEAEEAWRVVEPVLAAWAAGTVPLLGHPAGTAAPPPLR